MKYDVTIDKELFSVYSEIRLGLLRFHADVKVPDDHFWDYMNMEVLPQVRRSIEGKEWGEIPGIKGSRAAYKAFGRNPGRYRVSSEALIRRVRRGGELVGIEVDLAARFCEDNGYGLNIEAINFDGILPAIVSGKADFAAAGITITEERRESVNFSIPYYTGGTVMAVLKNGQTETPTAGQPGKSASHQCGTIWVKLKGERVKIFEKDKK